MSLKLTPISQATAKGRRPYQEDRFFTASLPQGLLFGVFDGHGGEDCAQKASDLFPGIFADSIGEPGQSAEEALYFSFISLVSATLDHEDGSTASVVYIPWSSDRAYVAVLGDSPVIVKRADQSIWHAPEHNVRTNHAEAQAAQERGGVIYGGYLTMSFSGPGLQMSRALGDRFLHKVLNRVPEVSEHVLGAGSFVLACTDGALDPGHEATETEAQNVVALIQSGGDAQAIVDRAIEIPTRDNVTALLVRIETEE